MDKDKLIAQLRAELAEWKNRHQSCMIKNAEISKSLQLFEGVFNNSPIPIQILNKEGFSVRENRAHKELFDAKPPEKHSFFEDSQFGRQPDVDRKFKWLKAGKVIRIEDSTYNAHEVDPDFPDKPLHIRSVGFPIFDTEGNPESYVLMLEDFTERKHDEEQKAEMQRQLECLNNNLLKVSENEKKHLADEFHFYFSTPLAMIIKEMNNLKENISDKDSLAEVEKTLELAKNSREMVRLLINDISKVKLPYPNIVEAINDYIKLFSETYHIQIPFEAQADLQLDRNVEFTLYRIVQESLKNIACHAQANNASVSLKTEDKKVYCKIIDNGVGILPDAIESSQSNGLQSMKHRCEYLNGTCSIAGRPGSGTIIEAIIPLSH